ncbi:hypothetical protein ACN9JG_21000 (plasmid) [Cereibacter azotoformans]|uniref:hypothetical protein n=1 Tax=Cereibacter TaxID=1653176 RepID=UPI00119DBD0C|nr:hypothetical protein [Cereibacter sediminicola]
MAIHTADQNVFKRTAQTIAKLPDAPKLSACQHALARASGHRDLHHMQAVQGKGVTSTIPDAAGKAAIIDHLHQELGLRIGDLCHALFRTRFFGPVSDPAEALSVRERLFEREFAAAQSPSLGIPCKIAAPRQGMVRAMMLDRGAGPNGLSHAVTDHGILNCVSREMLPHPARRLFVPLQFWVPYGYWVDADGAKVLFSRDYCPLWRIQEGSAPERDNPDRRVRHIEQHWFSGKGGFSGPVDRIIERGLEILREHRVVSVPQLVEWFPDCLKQQIWISDMKRKRGRAEMARAG